MADWLTDFVDHTSYGETPPKVMWWVGVATIAGALRRKVWIEQNYFQWTPNFYLLIVAPPGSIKKSTSIDLGMRMLRKVPEIDFGPQIVTWQQLITHMAGTRQIVDVDGKSFDMSCCTIALSEFGSFFDPSNRELIDNLTDIWDSKLGTIKKETKTNGDDEIVNPWLNILACTTPGWVSDNFSSKLVGSGFASRPIFLFAQSPLRDVPYPSRSMPKCSAMDYREQELVGRLTEISQFAGQYEMTEAAYVWGEKWYMNYRDKQRKMGSSTEAGFYERKQTHLHKTAMVICAAKGRFPVISVEEMEEADYRLGQLEEDVRSIFGFVGQSNISKTAREIIEVLVRVGAISKREMFKRYFFRTMSSKEFDEAMTSAIESGMVLVNGALNDAVVSLRNKS